MCRVGAADRLPEATAGGLHRDDLWGALPQASVRLVPALHRCGLCGALPRQQYEPHLPRCVPQLHASPRLSKGRFSRFALAVFAYCLVVTVSCLQLVAIARDCLGDTGLLLGVCWLCQLSAHVGEDFAT